MIGTWISRAILVGRVVGLLPVTLIVMAAFWIGMFMRNIGGWLFHWGRWLVGDSQRYSDTWTLVGRALTVDLIRDGWDAR